MNLHVVLYPALVGFSVLPDSGIRLVDTPFVSLGVSGDGFSVRSQSPSLHFYYSTTHIVNTMGNRISLLFLPRATPVKALYLVRLPAAEQEQDILLKWVNI